MYDINALSSGFYMGFSKKVKGDIYYLWQTTESNGKWEDVGVIGTGLKFYF
jgi:hypothetical protein